MGHLANLRLALRRDKAIDDPLLNRLGLQVARTAAARGVHRLRRRPAVAHHLSRSVATLDREGCVAIAGFLDEAGFERVRAAAQEALDSDVVRDHVRDGANEIEVLWRTDLPLAIRDDLDRFFCHPDLLALGGAAERTVVEPGAGRCTLQRLRQVAGERDRQADIHVDTFHPTHKAWLYLTPVTADDGPLVYYPRSQHADLRSLRAVYAESNAANEGSRRVADEEIASRGLERTEFDVPTNTLVIADTSGYHGRCQGRPPGSRIVLTVELRCDPFRRARSLSADTSTAKASR